MNIIKDILGNILLMNGHYVVRKWADIATDLILNGDSVVIKQTAVDDYAMYASDINYYQVLPEQSVHFYGSAAQLLDVLANNIFSTTTVCIFGCDVTAAVDVTYDNAVSGLAATDVQAAIDELAASSGGGGIYYNKNIFQNMTAIVGTAGSSVALGANDLVYYGIFIQERITVIDVRVTMVSGSGNAAFAMYEATSSGAIGTKLFNSAQVAAGANVSNIYTFPSPQVFERGMYYFAVNQSGTCTYYAIAAGQTFPAFGGLANSAAQRNAGAAVVAYNVTLPTSPPALSLLSVSVPILYFNLQP